MDAPTPYDELPYSNHPHHQTHPDTLAAVARLHGLRAPRPATARVLELACGAGGHLIGLAYACPGVRAVGIDLAPSAIETARGLAAEHGLRNVAFEVADVLDLTDGRLGEFDYVVAHGLYAWVPDAVRDALMAAIAAHLAPDGVAYVSYNAEPTGHIRRTLRDAGLWWARDAAGERERAGRMRELIGALVEHRARPDAPDFWGRLLWQETRALRGADDSELVHDLLGEFWRPVWFADFAAHAARHGLDYVGEARMRDLRPRPLPAGLGDLLDGFSGGDRIAREQYLDIFLSRGFRESVLCRAGRDVSTDVDPSAIEELSWRIGAAEVDGDDPQALRDATELLARRRPQAVPFPELADSCGITAEQVLAALRGGTLRAHAELPAAAPPGEKPHASAVARQTARAGIRVTTLYNGIVFIEDPRGRALLELMDGTRDLAALRADLLERTGLELTEEAVAENVASLGRYPLFHG